VTSTARLGLLAVSLALLLFPLALPQPGVPTHLKADEGAYYGMALSLAHDGDLRLEVRDVDRYFDELPYGPVNNVILMTRDGWRTVHFGKPWVYSLFAAPLVRLLGLDGMLLTNALLLVAMLWMGAAHLRRHNDEGLAALFAGGFFLLSLALAYTTWLQPEIFSMAAVAACLFLGLPRDEEEGLRRPRRDLALAALSGAALALAVYNKPMVALVGLAPLVGMVRRRRLRAAVAWLAGAAACVAALAAVSLLLTGTPNAYLGVQRGGFTLCGPGLMPVVPADGAQPAAATAAPQPSPPTPGSTPAASPAATAPLPAPADTQPTAGRAAAAAAAASPTGNAWSWLLRVPDTSPSELADNLGYFLWGRHTGLLLYTPFAALAVLLFLLHGRRSLERWVLLASLLTVGLVFLLQISWNWQGGGGFVGNRYFVNVYPAFLFLVTRIRPRAVVTAGYAVGGLLLGPLLLSPFGSPVVEPTLQAHTRSRPLRWFPLELTLRNVPGYYRVPMGDLRVVGRRDVLLPQGEELWVHGADTVELWLLADRPLGRTVWDVRGAAGGNAIHLRFGAEDRAVELGPGQTARVELPAREPDRRWRVKEGTLHAWRLLITSDRGAVRTWTRGQPPPSCRGWPHDPTTEESFYLGAALAYLGDGEHLDDDVYAVEWQRVIAPPRVVSGSRFTVRVAMVNRSAAAWPERGPARVRLSYHWRDASGRVVVSDGRRTELPRRVGPGETVRALQDVVAPAVPGSYVLELDPVFELVSWFGERGARTLRVPIEVVSTAEGGEPAPAATAADGAANAGRAAAEER
jgi:hypothetical protein